MKGKMCILVALNLFTMAEKQVHEGRAVKRIREILGKKQPELAADLGITQQAVSLLEAKETIDPAILEDVAKALKVPVDAIKNFNEDATISIIANTFNADSAAYVENYKCSFNPIDKVVELYERLLKEKDVLIEQLSKGSK